MKLSDKSLEPLDEKMVSVTYAAPSNRKMTHKFSSFARFDHSGRVPDRKRLLEKSLQPIDEHQCREPSHVLKQTDVKQDSDTHMFLRFPKLFHCGSGPLILQFAKNLRPFDEPNGVV